MIPENIIWAFFSKELYDCSETSPDTYYKDTTGKLVKITQIFQCVETGRGCCYPGSRFLGAVLENTKIEVKRGCPPDFNPVITPEKTSKVDFYDKKIDDVRIKYLLNKYNKIFDTDIDNNGRYPDWYFSDRPE